MEPITGSASVLVLAICILAWSALTIERHKHRMRERERERARRAAYAAWLFTRKVNRMANQRVPRGWNHV